MAMDALPNWPGAEGAYAKAYKILDASFDGRFEQRR